MMCTWTAATAVRGGDPGRQTESSTVSILYDSSREGIWGVGGILAGTHRVALFKYSMNAVTRELCVCVCVVGGRCCDECGCVVCVHT